MSSKDELLGMVETLRKAISLEESALGVAISGRNAEAIRISFHELARLRARLMEAEREASESN